MNASERKGYIRAGLPARSIRRSPAEPGLVLTRSIPASFQARSPRPSARMTLAALVTAFVLVIALAPSNLVAASAKPFTLTVEKKAVNIGGGMTYDAWTYDGTVPGPALRIREGDEVAVQLLNHTMEAHGINIHAAQIPENHFGGHTSATLNYKFRADVPGVFAYHCNAIPILDHIGLGMYGVVIVDPKGGWPSGPAQEITLVQSEFFGIPRANGRIIPDHSKMLLGRPDFVVFNGQLNKYGMEDPIAITVGKLVRVFFLNAGPTLTSSFHVAGAIFDTVYQGGNPANALHGLDHVGVDPSAGAVFEFKVTEPGDYRFMDLNRVHQYKGAMGVFRAQR